MSLPATTPTVGPTTVRPDLDEERRDRFNERLLEAVNDAGPVFLSHTRLGGRLVLRLAIGNLRTTPEHVARAWEIVRGRAAELAEAERVAWTSRG